ncbi:FAD-binding oxidoreductase [Nocardia donostiensis]|uniref:FAD-binding protein n=1 Tax=Nocardia donostiensis TaxID=1538463 RepID=A0A1V2T9A2_9NOCA|nr:FAD-binding oxidoreductase [Nocardia donostiensis]ONM46087.1 FAD-binding protein [Nocardia donostiensis]OQS12409.1 FAD-binding protein [Nocardia donostiensis]OQS17974.1 FAD-binding protein [Nocardia donostiensis]
MSTPHTVSAAAYLPRDTADVVRTVRDSRDRSQSLAVHGGEPALDGLAVPDQRAVVSLRRMNSVLDLNLGRGTVRVQAGARLSDIDRRLGAHGLGLPIVGDHRDITAGGFASVGGVSTASHRYGMFIDQIVDLEYVDTDGRIGTCGRHHHTERFHRILGAGGRAGIITALTLDTIEIDKDRTWLSTQADRFLDFDTFVEHAHAEITRPGAAVLQVGRWVDTAPLKVSRPVGTGRVQLGTVRFGQWSSLYPTSPTRSLRARREVGSRARKSLGAIASASSGKAGMPVRNAAAGAVMFTPKVLTLRDAEYLADTVISSSERGPAYRVGVFAPTANYTSVFYRLHDLFSGHRERTGCFTVISAMTYGVRSRYLRSESAGRGLPAVDHGLITFTCRLRPSALPSEQLRDIVTGIDEICRSENALRYESAD